MPKEKKGKKNKKPDVVPMIGDQEDFDSMFEAIAAGAQDLEQETKVAEWQLPTDLSGQPRPEDAIRFGVHAIYDVRAIRMLAAAFEDATTSPNPDAVKFLKQYVAVSLQNCYPAAKAVAEILGERARESAATYGWNAADGWPNDEAYSEFARNFDSSMPPGSEEL